MFLAATLASASAQTAPKAQEGPTTIWDHPGGAELLDGVGAWVYVAPQAPAGPDQLAVADYQYLLSFNYPGLRMGFIGLASGAEGKFAGMVLVDNPVPAARVALDWQPGRFYYLLYYSLGGNQWGGWVYDLAANSWTFIGRITAAEGWGRLTPSSRTMVSWDGPQAADCAAYPRTDAYFYPVVGYRGTSFSIASLGFHYVQPGDCATQTSIEYDWVHYRLGA